MMMGTRSVGWKRNWGSWGDKSSFWGPIMKRYCSTSWESIWSCRRRSLFWIRGLISMLNSLRRPLRCMAQCKSSFSEVIVASRLLPATESITWLRRTRPTWLHSNGSGLIITASLRKDWNLHSNRRLIWKNYNLTCINPKQFNWEGRYRWWISLYSSRKIP